MNKWLIYELLFTNDSTKNLTKSMILHQSDILSERSEFLISLINYKETYKTKTGSDLKSLLKVSNNIRMTSNKNDDSEIKKWIGNGGRDNMDATD